MGGIVTPPLKLLDSRLVPASTTRGSRRRRSSRAARGTCATRSRPSTGSSSSAPTSRPTAGAARCSGSKLTNPKKNARTVNVFVDAHSELMTQYPWGFGGHRAQRERQRARHAARSTAAGWSSATPGSCRGEARGALLHGARRLGPRRRWTARPGPGYYGPYGAGRECAGDDPSRCRRSATTGRSAAARAGSCTTAARSAAAAPTTLWVAVAGSENSPAEAAHEFAALTDDPAGLLARQRARRERLAQRTQLDLPADRQLADSIEWGKQNLRDLTQVAEDVDLRWTDEGTGGSRTARSTACAGSARASPTTRGCSAWTASTPRTRRSRSASSARSRTTCARCATSPTSSATARAWSCTRSSRTARSGTARTRARRTRRAWRRTTSTRTRSSSSRPPWR